jgi:predicted alpha/beta superfamily hydrolase
MVPEKPGVIFFAGDVNHWNPADTAFQLNYLNGYYQGNFSNFPTGKTSFKFTKGDWGSVEKDKNGADIPNRLIDLNSDSTLIFYIPGKFGGHSEVTHSSSAQVSILDSAFYIPQLHSFRRIWIYLPPGYKKSKKEYPVIYAQDGQNLFDAYTSFSGEWRIDETLDSMYESKGIASIVIGIDNSKDRMREYNPFDTEEFGSGLGAVYTEFIAETLKPFVDTHYRTLKDPAHTVITGSSMGGLISYYAALTRPDVFGKGGFFSTSFWIAPQIDSLTSLLSDHLRGQYFFYAGSREGKEMINDMYNIADKLSANSRALAYVVVDAEGRHNEAAWRKWFPEFVSWIFSNGYEYQLSLL